MNLLNITIEYCSVWHYTERAVSLTAELLRNNEQTINSLKLIPSNGGRFEVTVNDLLIYSKLQTKRHANPGEVSNLIKKMIEDKNNGEKR